MTGAEMFPLVTEGIDQAATTRIPSRPRTGGGDPQPKGKGTSVSDPGGGVGCEQTLGPQNGGPPPAPAGTRAIPNRSTDGSATSIPGPPRRGACSRAGCRPRDGPG